MTHVNDNLVNLSSDSRGIVPLVQIITFMLLIIPPTPHPQKKVSYSSELERISSDFLDRETSFDESSFDVFLFYDDVKSDCIVSFAPTPLVAIGDSDFPVLTSPEAQVNTLNAEEIHTFIRNYQSTFDRDPSDVEIRIHIVCET